MRGGLDRPDRFNGSPAPKPEPEKPADKNKPGAKSKGK